MAIQEIVDALAENFEALITDIEQTAENSVETITEHMAGIGYTPTDEFSRLLNESGIAVSVSDMVTALKDHHAKMEAYADRVASSAEATATADGTTGNTTNGTNAGTTSKTTTQTGSAGTNPGTALKGGKEPLTVVNMGSTPTQTPLEAVSTGAVNKELELKTKAASYLNKNLKKTTAKRDSLSDTNKKFYDKYSKKILTTKQMKELAKLLGVKYDNQKSSGTLYKKLKEIGVKGFKVGSQNIPYDQLAFLGEEGNELQFDKSKGVLREVGQGDMVFTNEMSRRLWELSKLEPEVIRQKHGMPDIPAQPITQMTTPISITENNQVNHGNVNITFGDLNFPDVTNPREFANNVEGVMCNAMCTNGRTRKCVIESVASEFIGKGIGAARLWR